MFYIKLALLLKLDLFILTVFILLPANFASAVVTLLTSKFGSE